MWLFSLPKFDYQEFQKEQLGQLAARSKMSTKDIMELKIEERNGRDPLRQQQIDELFKLVNLNNPEANYKLGEDKKTESPIEETETIYWDEETEEIVVTVTETETIENEKQNIAELPVGAILNYYSEQKTRYGKSYDKLGIFSKPAIKFRHNFPKHSWVDLTLNDPFYPSIIIEKPGLSLQKYKFNADIVPSELDTKNIYYMVGIWDENTQDWLKYHASFSQLPQPYLWTYKHDFTITMVNYMPAEETHPGFIKDAIIPSEKREWNGQEWISYQVDYYYRWYDYSFENKPEFRLSLPEQAGKRRKKYSIDETKIKRRIRREKEEKKMRNCCSCASIAAMFARKHAEDIKMYRNLIKVIRSTAQEEIEIHAQQLEEVNAIDFNSNLTGKRLWLGDKNLANDKE